jgi:hypothetical protein
VTLSKAMLTFVICSASEAAQSLCIYRNASTNQSDAFIRSEIIYYDPYFYRHQGHGYYHRYQVPDCHLIRCKSQNRIGYPYCPSMQLSHHQVYHFQAISRYSSSSLMILSRKNMRIRNKLSRFGDLWLANSY